MRRLFSRTLLYGGAGAVGLLLGFVRHKWPYYSLPAAARPLHALHEWLRPAGKVGLTAGLAGTGLILLNLGYLVRKRIPSPRLLGSLRVWMDLHVFTGVIACGLILVHSAFLARSGLGVLALSGLLVAVVTGTLGRYVYGFVPRSLEGRELEIEEVRQRLLDHRREVEKLGFDLTALFADQQASAGEPASRKGLAAALLVIVLGDRALRRKYKELKEAVVSSPATRALADQILPLLADLCRERAWLARYHELRSLMGSWRFLHRWLAILMVSLVLFHVGVALRYGNLWILRSSR
jgi:hypothetical protein